MDANKDFEALMGDVGPLEKRDLTLMVLDRIKIMLEKGILKAGSKLPTEQEMTRVLGISRPSLRQAYKFLSILGILRAVPGDGTYISDSTSKVLAMPLMFLMLMKKISLEDIFGFRITVEGELASLAATRATAEEVEKIRNQIHLMTSALADRKRYLEAEYEFHNRIARAAHNPLLLEIILIVSELLWEMRKALVPVIPEIKDDLRQHRNIYEKIRARNAEAAREAMHLHLRAALQLAKKSGLVKESDVSESEKAPSRKKRA